MTAGHTIPALLDTMLALAAMVLCTNIVGHYIDQKARAERPLEGDDAPFLTTTAIIAIVLLTFVAFGAIGWLAG